MADTCLSYVQIKLKAKTHSKMEDYVYSLRSKLKDDAVCHHFRNAYCEYFLQEFYSVAPFACIDNGGLTSEPTAVPLGQNLRSEFNSNTPTVVMHRDRNVYKHNLEHCYLKMPAFFIQVFNTRRLILYDYQRDEVVDEHQRTVLGVALI